VPHSAVVVPWRPGDAHREAAWSWVRSRYEAEHPTWQVVPGTCTGPWVKAHAVADALTRTDADRILIADADCWSNRLAWALDQLDEWPYAIPHHTVYRLTEAATAAVLAGGPLGGETTQHPYKGYAGGGFLALHRDLYEQVPLDPRFVGWGQEDQAWHLALRRIAGHGPRGRADLWHLFHPPQPRLSRQTGSEASAALLHRYQRANTAEKMADLIAEVTHAGEDRPEPQGDPRAPSFA
jgi:hypothetical protein